MKTYLIIILAVGNALLGGLFGFRFFSEAAAQRQSDEQLVALLAERGVFVRELPSETAAALVLSRDFAAEGSAAAALLGEAQMADLGGGAVEYQNGAGYALFRSGGRFNIDIRPERGAVYTDLEKACREMLADMGFLNVSEGFLEEFDSDGGVLLTFGQDVERRHLYNARAVFHFSDGGELLSVSGLWALGAVNDDDGAQCKSAGAALLLFAVNHDAEVLRVELGYRLGTQTATAESARLGPEWRVVCADGEFYLDGFTGAVVEREE
ncbi:MAG: hypothetical protein FWH16_02580 [Oscillospiraceae bacterium]|nr:hypothetical protein [Oscillospiraceae bacterium]